MKQIGFLFLFISLLLGGCQRDEMVTAEQSSSAVKEHLWMIKRLDTAPVTKGVAEKSKLWNPGDTIRIKFLSGGAYTPVLEQKVKQYAAIWLQYACLYFEYVSADEAADVKIGFDLDERCISWAVTGTDCRAVPQNECSLNFFELGMYGEENDKAEILRGFGHVLGFGFEHRNPESPIVFNARAQNYFRNVCMLTDQDIADLLTLYNSEQTHHTKYDEYSIMVLEFPRIILTSPHTMISANMELSEKDKELVAELYPLVDDALVTMKTTKREFLMKIRHTGDIQVDWGDGCVEMNVFEHTYLDDIEHTIRLQGDPWALKELDVQSCELSLLKVDNCTGLEVLISEHNLLTNINLKKNLSLLTFASGHNLFTKLDVTSNIALIELLICALPIEQIDISKNVNLENLSICEVLLDSIDLSFFPKLKSISCSSCFLRKIDFSNNANLELVTCGENQLTELSFAHNPKLRYVSVNQNPFLYDDLKLLDFVNSLPLNDLVQRRFLGVNDSNVADKIRPILTEKGWDVQ